MTTYQLSNSERVVIVEADNITEAISKVDFYPTTRECLLIVDELRADLEGVESEINAEYWRFCRCARANPPRAELYTKKHKIEARLYDILNPVLVRS
jgi:hypothetical protein